MAERPTKPDPYLARHVRDALASDPRVSELGVDVEITDDAVVLSGDVTSPERREAASEVARDLVPGHEIRNETTVPETPEPNDAKHLR